MIIGATNTVDFLDPAILRSGRFDKVVNIPLPDKESRQNILKYYLQKIKTEWFLDIESIASRTTGMTGADMRNIVNLAVLRTIKEKRVKTSQQDFEYALDRILIGIGRKSLVIDPKEKLMTAYHEGGHTLMNLLTDSAIELHKVTILPRGSSLGHTSFINKYDMYDFTTDNLRSMLDIVRFC